MSSRAPFPVSEQILAMVTGYQHPECIAERVLPVIKVDAEQFKFTKISLKDSLQLPDTKVGRKSRPNEMETSATEVDQSTDDHAIDDFVPNADLDKQRPGFDPKLVAAQATMRVIKMAQEIRVRDKVFGAASYEPANVSDINGTPFSASATDPIDLIESAKDSMLVMPNQAVMGRDVFSALQRNPNIVKAKHGTSGDKGLASIDDLQNLFDMEFIVGHCVEDTAKPGQAVNWSRIWKNDFALQYIDTSISSSSEPTMTQGFIAHFDDVGAEIPDEGRGIKGGVTIRAGHQRTEVLCSAISGYLFRNAA